MLHGRTFLNRSVYISVVSHGHYEVIASINCLSRLKMQEGVHVVVVDNKNDKKLKWWCAVHQIHYIQNQKPRGFGENNNVAFEFCKKLPFFSIQRDWFLVINPDVDISSEMFLKLIESLDDGHPVCSINLYRDEDGLVSDDSIRKFPTFWDFASSLLIGVNKTKVNKSLIKWPCEVDWAAGSFLVFKADHYERLGGFDQAYFMYCEDIDICYRSARHFGFRVRYLPEIRARHIAQHGNRRIFSKHFYWHLVSTFRFLWQRFKEERKRKLI